MEKYDSDGSGVLEIEEFIEMYRVY